MIMVYGGVVCVCGGGAVVCGAVVSGCVGVWFHEPCCVGLCRVGLWSNRPYFVGIWCAVLLCVGLMYVGVCCEGAVLLMVHTLLVTPPHIYKSRSTGGP